MELKNESIMKKKKLHILMFGAHPDDCEYLAGGSAYKYRLLGHEVKFVSITNGDTGHYSIGVSELAEIRKNESMCVSSITGIEYEILNIHSNGLEVDILTRERIIRIIRSYGPDMIFTHRLYDYHPDHRRTAVLIQDSSYAVRVPNVCQDIPCLKYSPVILYMQDNFKKPVEFTADIVIDIDDSIDKKTCMLNCHRSQFYEWLPWMDNELHFVPKDDKERLSWLKERQISIDGITAERFRSKLVDKYGKISGMSIMCAEAFEISEYGRQLTKDMIKTFFPF